MKTAVLIVTSLLATHPFLVTAETAIEGPVELSASGMDSVTAGTFPSAVRQVTSDVFVDRTTRLANGSTTLDLGTTTSRFTTVSLPTRSTQPDRGTTGGTTDPRETASETGVERDSRRPDFSCLRARTCGASGENASGPDASAPGPIVGTVDNTGTQLSTQMSVFGKGQSPGAYVIDFVHHRVGNLR